jgi:hypothetical protein
MPARLRPPHGLQKKWIERVLTVVSLMALLALAACANPTAPDERANGPGHTTSSGNHTTSSGNVGLP